MQGVGADVAVLVPREERVRFIIDTLARFICDDGTDLEQMLLEGEHRNPEFDFLRDVAAPEHMYYRWRIYSLCNGDSMAAWRAEPFVMIEQSRRLMPPPLHAAGKAPATAAQRGAPLQNSPRSEALAPAAVSHHRVAWRAGVAGSAGKDVDAQLSDMERERLEDTLRGLSIERASVRAAMLFALEHAACAAEICDVLVAALTLAETPPHLKVARRAPPPSFSGGTCRASLHAIRRARRPLCCCAF